MFIKFFYLNIFCFEGFIVRNLMVQLEFNLDIYFSSYDFFSLFCM